MLSCGHLQPKHDDVCVCVDDKRVNSFVGACVCVCVCVIEL